MASGSSGSEPAAFDLPDRRTRRDCHKRRPGGGSACEPWRFRSILRAAVASANADDAPLVKSLVLHRSAREQATAGRAIDRDIAVPAQRKRKERTDEQIG